MNCANWAKTLPCLKSNLVETSDLVFSQNPLTSTPFNNITNTISNDLIDSTPILKESNNKRKSNKRSMFSKLVDKVSPKVHEISDIQLEIERYENHVLQKLSNWCWWYKWNK